MSALSDLKADVLAASVQDPSGWSAVLPHNGGLEALLSGRIEGLSRDMGQAFGAAWFKDMRRVLRNGDYMPVFMVRADGLAIKVGIKHGDGSITVLTYSRVPAAASYWGWQWLLVEREVVGG